MYVLYVYDNACCADSWMILTFKHILCCWMFNSENFQLRLMAPSCGFPEVSHQALKKTMIFLHLQQKLGFSATFNNTIIFFLSSPSIEKNMIFYTHILMS